VSFQSILFDWPAGGVAATTSTEPDCFKDLNLDQIVASLTAGREEYGLKPFFYTPLTDVGAISYRHEIMRDLESRELSGQIESFAKRMRYVREQLGQLEKLSYPYQKQRCFLDAVDAYCDAVDGLARDLTSANLHSRGLRLFRDYLASYTGSEAFVVLLAETKQQKADLSTLQYCLFIEGNRVTVSSYSGELDYEAEVLQTFEKFRQGGSTEYKFSFQTGLRMNHVEEAVLDRVARLNPDVFSSLAQYCDRHRGFVDETLRAFDREIQFYVACLDRIRLIKAAGLTFCYPSLSAESKEISAHGCFDLALAGKLTSEKKQVVCNDFYLSGRERILVVSGANQGGKTSFARTFGQLHYLASVGCLVPGSEARLFLYDRLFTHFEQEEDLQNLRSKLENDLSRIHAILEQATSRSILIMNESFSSTTLNDALFLSKRVMTQIRKLDLLCVSVTFFDELTSLGETTVSMVGTVDPVDRTRRTFSVIRKPADGLAYALAIAEKYRLTYADIRKRVRS
jgi:DNA mismatch repair protein MutS